MIWPAAQALYFLIGCGFASVIAPAMLGRSAMSVGAEVLDRFVVVFGIIMLWPVLLLLAADQRWGE